MDLGIMATTRKLSKSERIRQALRDARADGRAGDTSHVAEQNAKEERAIRVRLTLAAMVLVCAFLFLGARVYAIQVIHHDEYLTLWGQSEVTETLPAVRGAIRGEDGTLYAVTRMTGKSLYVVPCLMDGESRLTLAHEIGATLDRDPEALLERFLQYADRQFLWVKRQLTEAEIEALTPVVEGQRAAGFRDETIRLYPQRQLLANVLGFVGIDGNGLEGIERAYEDHLAGTDGQRHLLRDGRGRRVGDVDFPEVPPEDGADLVLTIDQGIQVVLEEELDAIIQNWVPKGAWGVVLDSQTGAILAMASRPGFDANAWRTTVPDDRRNRVVTDVFEPGSVMKPMVMMAALRDGVFPTPPVPPRGDDGQPLAEYLAREPQIHCENGAYRIAHSHGRLTYRRTLHDAHGYGRLPLSMVLVKSSNIGMAKVGLALGPDHEAPRILMAEMRDLGFGAPTRCGLPGEIGGILPDWEGSPCSRVFTLPSVTMGHSIGVTTLQMARAFNVIANGGALLRPYVVSRIVHPDGREEVVGQREVERRLYPEDHPAIPFVRDALTRVCRTGGTARRANLDEYGIAVAGKTGTAEKYGVDETVCSFAGFAPADNPRYTIMITVDAPSEHFEGMAYYGGTVAAPAVRNVLLRTFRSRDGAPRADTHGAR